MIDLVLLPDDNFNQDKIIKLMEKYDNSKINKVYTPVEITGILQKQEIITTQNKVNFIKEIEPKITNDFMIFSDYKSNYDLVSDLSEQLIFKINQGTKSLLNTNSPFAPICYTIEKLDLKKTKALIQKIEMANIAERKNSITNVNNTIFNYDIYKEIGGFDFSYATYEEIHFDYNYKIADSGYENIVLQNRIIPQSFDQKYVFDYDVEKRIKRVLEKWSLNYLGYETIYYSNLDLNKVLRKKIEQKQITNLKGNILKIVPPDLFTNGLNGHVDDLINGLNEYNVFCLMPTFSINEAKFFEIVQYYNGAFVQRIRLPYSASMHISNFDSKEYAKLIEIVIKHLKIDLLHIHIAGVGHSLNSAQIAKKMGVKTILSLHDLYYISGDFTQTNPAEKYYEQTILQKYSIHNVSKFNAEWQNAVQELFDEVDKVIVFSSSYPEIYSKHYDIKNFKIIEHGYQFDQRYHLANPKIKNESFKIVYFGRVEEEKGSEILREIAQAKLKNVELHVLGVVDDKWFEKRIGKNGPKLYVYGKYNREELPQILGKIKPHIAIIPSIWDEAFAYTLSEAIVYGIVPVVSNRGALGARIRDYQIGYAVDTNNIDNVFNCIDRIRSLTDEEWAKQIDKVNQCHVTTVQEMNLQYLELYENNGARAEQVSGEEIDQRIKQMVGDYMAENSDLLYPYLNFYQSKSMSETKIQNSKLWKIAQKIYKLRKNNK
jgi:glycosyltransferase involved in cell wall biosynthesis